jgi:hypothetical protein
MRAARLVPAVVVLLAALPALVYTIDPFARDQGVFATIAWRWLEGEVPYVSAGMEHKGPLPFAAYAISFLLFGRDLFAARLLGWIGLVVAGWGTAWLAGRAAEASGMARGRTVAAGVAGGLCVLVAGLGGLSTWWSGAQAETFMEPLSVLALVVAVRAAGGRRSWSLLFLAGCLLGLASLGKPTVLLLVPVVAAIVPRDRRGRGVLFHLAGIVAPWVLAILYFASRGAAGAFVESVVTANLDYGSRGLSLVPRMLGNFLPVLHSLVDLRFVPLAALGLFVVARGRGSGAARLPVPWLLAACLMTLLQGRLFGYHFLPIVAPFAALAGIGAASAVAVGGRQRSLVAAAVLLAFLGIDNLDWRDWDLRRKAITGRITRTSFLQQVAPRTDRADVDPAETVRAARWAADRLRPEETLLVWGFEPAVNFLAERRSPTRFIYDYFLTSSAVPPERRRRYWELFWLDLDRTPPDWIAVVSRDRNPLESEDSAAQLAREPRLREYLEREYEPEAAVGDFEFHRRARK